MSVKDEAAEMRLAVSSPDAEKALLPPLAKAVPQFLAASRMLEAMELAALRLMKLRLRTGESSIGIAMNLTHVVAGAVRGNMRAVATYRGVTGRMHRFTINAFDESGLIGSCEHTRAVVPEKRLLAIAHRRAGKPENLVSQ